MRKYRALGQHALVDLAVVDAMVEAAELRGDEVVYEIGTGSGVLTNRLCSLARRVISCEVDEALFSAALGRLNQTNLTLVKADGFDVDVEFDVFVSSLPYYCSSRFVRWLLGKKFNRAVVLLQKEFVEKLLAGVGERWYRAVSVLAQYSFDIKPVRDVPPDSFTPKPKVQSTIVVIKPKQNGTLSKVVIQAVYRLFALRNKKVSTALKMLTRKSDLGPLQLQADLLNKRIDELTPEEAVGLAKILAERLDRTI